MKLLARTRLFNGLLLVVAMLSTAAVWWTKDMPSATEAKARQHHLLTEYDADSVSRLVLLREQQRTVLVRVDQKQFPGASRFRLRQPVETDAEESAVDKLLGTLRYATWIRKAKSSPLDSASPLLEIKMGGNTVRMTLGATSVSPEGSHYLRVQQVEAEADGDTPERVTKGETFVISARLVRDLFVPPEVFRGRQLVPYRKSSIERIILSSAAGTRRMVERDGVFRFDQMNGEQRVERRGLDKIFLSLARAVADPFIDLEVAQAALQVQATVRVSLLARDHERPEASLEFGGQCPGQPGKALVVRHLPEPLAGCVASSVMTALREPADTLVDRGLFTLSRDEVDTVRLQAGARSLTLVRKGTGFRLRTVTGDTASADDDPGSAESAAAVPEPVEVTAEVAEDRLRRILGLRGELLLGKRQPRSGEKFSYAVITMESSTVPGRERVVETVRIAKPRKTGAVYAYRESDGAVLLLPSGNELALRADSTLLKPLGIFDYGASQILGVTVQRSGKGIPTQELSRSDSDTGNGTWKLLRPKRYGLDDSLRVELIDRLRNMKAVRWITDQSSKSFGLVKPRATVTLRVMTGDRSIKRVLRVGRSAPGGYYASVDRNPGVFVLSRSTWRAIDTLLLSRSVFRVERDSIFELSIVLANRKRLLVRRVAGELTVLKAPESFDRDSLDLLIEALENLHAEAAVHLGREKRGEGLKRPVLRVSVRRRAASKVGKSRLRFKIGSRDTFQGASIYYARRSSVTATYALPRRQVQSLLDFF